jgi:hypothetical protein
MVKGDDTYRQLIQDGIGLKEEKQSDDPVSYKVSGAVKNSRYSRFSKEFGRIANHESRYIRRQVEGNARPG